MKLICYVLLFFSFSHAYGFEFPVMGRRETGHFLIDAERAERLILGANYGNLTSGNSGVCYGIDRLNFILLSRVKIAKSEQADGDGLIYEKLVRAYENSEDVTIFSTSSSPAEFMRGMHERWRKPGNPLNRAIEYIFNSKRNADLSSRADPTLQALGGYSLTPPPDYFLRQIKEGIPVSIGIIVPAGARHALTIYGFKQTNEGDPSVFYVLDSNNPGKFWELVFDRTQHHWYYGPWNSRVDIVTESTPYGQGAAIKGKFALFSISGPPQCRALLE